MASQAPRPRASGCSGLAWRRRSGRGPWTCRHRPRWSPEALLAAIPSFPRPLLSRLTERMIDRMDEMDSDPDLEPDGDELDGAMGEDDFHPQGQNWLGHPGCPVSDPGEDEPDDEDSHDREAEETYD